MKKKKKRMSNGLGWRRLSSTVLCFMDSRTISANIQIQFNRSIMLLLTTCSDMPNPMTFNRNCILLRIPPAASEKLNEHYINLPREPADPFYKRGFGNEADENVV